MLFRFSIVIGNHWHFCFYTRNFVENKDTLQTKFLKEKDGIKVRSHKLRNIKTGWQNLVRNKWKEGTISSMVSCPAPFCLFLQSVCSCCLTLLWFFLPRPVSWPIRAIRSARHRLIAISITRESDPEISQ